jgi:hypothetical protein
MPVLHTLFPDHEVCSFINFSKKLNFLENNNLLNHEREVVTNTNFIAFPPMGAGMPPNILKNPNSAMMMSGQKGNNPIGGNLLKGPTQRAPPGSPTEAGSSTVEFFFFWFYFFKKTLPTVVNRVVL